MMVSCWNEIDAAKNQNKNIYKNKFQKANPGVDLRSYKQNKSIRFKAAKNSRLHVSELSHVLIKDPFLQTLY